MYLNGVYRLGSTAYVRVVFNAMGGEAEEDYVYYKTGRSLACCRTLIAPATIL